MGHSISAAARRDIRGLGATHIAARANRGEGANRPLEEGAGGPAAPDVPLSFGRWAWEWAKSFLIAIAFFLVIRTFLVEAYRIPTSSMENTLLAGDFLLVDKAAFGSFVPFTRVRVPAYDRPARGDVIVFTPPHDPRRSYVKRLIAVPHDTVEMRDKRVRVNGAPLDEPYVHTTDPLDSNSPHMVWQCAYHARTAAGPCRPMRDNWGPLVVPARQYLVLGDNRDNSEDSRYWGFVGRDDIRGRPLFIYYSFDPFSRRPLPWLTHIRWGRIGEAVH
ncbi:MAG: signal peptidase I [Longimicrobiales bacterium]